MVSELAAEENGAEGDVDGVNVSGRVFGFLVLGLVLVFVGIGVIAFAAALSGGESSSSGVVILIGPIPIILGSGPDSLVLILVGVVLTILSVILFMVLNRRFKKFDV